MSRIVCAKKVSACLIIIPSSEISGFISSKTDFFALLAVQGILSILHQHHGRGGFGVSWVEGLTNFSPRVSGSMFESYGFSGFEICHGTGCGFGHFWFSGFRYFKKRPR